MEGFEEGLRRDLPLILGRRRLIGGLAAVVAVGGCWDGSKAADALVCTRVPDETAGPFPSDGTNRVNGAVSDALRTSGVVRQDIRDSFAGMTGRAQGPRLDLTLEIADHAMGCAPRTGHAVYLWHCDIEGFYSMYEVPERNYLRGVQVTDADGLVRFTTAFPGVYEGRYPHIHLQVYRSLAAAGARERPLLTTQLALPETVARGVYSRATRIGPRGDWERDMEIERDFIFNDNGPAELAAMTLNIEGDDVRGYRGRASIAL